MSELLLVISARARADLLATRRWLGQPGSGLKARLKMARINRAISELRLAPERWPFGPIDGVRERLIEGYVVLYRPDRSAGRVDVLRVFGPFQDRSDL